MKPNMAPPFGRVLPSLRSNRAFTIGFIAVLLGLTISARLALAAENSAERLVERLVSTNPTPVVQGELAERDVNTVVSYPEGYELVKQKPVEKAYAAILQMREQAFPTLISHFDDRRYSMTCELAGAWYNYDVSQICRRILAEQLEPYHDFIAGGAEDHLHNLSYTAHFLNDKDEAIKWMQSRKREPLWKMQLEALEWLIKEDQKYDTITDVNMLKKRIDELRKNHKALEGIPISK